MSNDELILSAVANINELIRRNIKGLESERRHPGCDPDTSDDFMEDAKSAIEKLRSVREILEGIV